MGSKAENGATTFSMANAVPDSKEGYSTRSSSPDHYAEKTSLDPANPLHITLPTFRMVVLADELLEQFFESSFPASLHLTDDLATSQTPSLTTFSSLSLGRAAILHFPSRVGVTARLELTYRAPTYDLEFYVVRARPIVPDEDREVKEIPDAKKGESWSGRGPADAGKERKSDRKLWVEGAVESLNGKVNVSAKALFVVPRNVKLAPLGEGF